MRLLVAVFIVASFLITSAHSDYLGCYTNYYLLSTLEEDAGVIPGNKPKLCQSYCLGKNYVYAGLVAGLHCLCGNEEPNDNDKTDDDDCHAPCPGNSTELCGGPFTLMGVATAIYKTGLAPKQCKVSKTIVNGRQGLCENVVIFEDHFDVHLSMWSHVIKMPREPDYKFVIFDSDTANSYLSNRKLVIKPTVLSNDLVKHGDIRLKSCTALLSSPECGYKAKHFSILPPVQSARLTTKNSFAFQYGKVEIIAKLPLGDWLVPELWLEPKNETYGPGYRSGRIYIAMAFGNKDLTLNGEQIGNNYLTGGIVMAEEYDPRSSKIGNTSELGKLRNRKPLQIENKEGWYRSYHNYTVIWTPDNIVFEVDGRHRKELLPNKMSTLWFILGFDKINIWGTEDSKIAPFNQEFYITLGVSVGGDDVPDNSITNGTVRKPWKNRHLKSLSHFWRQRFLWESTWQNDTAALFIDSIKVTSL